MAHTEEIEAEHKGYEDTTTCDVNYLLAQLREVEKVADNWADSRVG